MIAIALIVSPQTHPKTQAIQQENKHHASLRMT